MIAVFMISIPAMLGTITIIHLATVVGITGALQKLFGEIDGVVKIVVIHQAGINVQLPFEFGAQRGPIPFEDVAQIEIFLPVGGDFRVYFTGLLIPQPKRIAIFTHG